MPSDTALIFIMLMSLGVFDVEGYGALKDDLPQKWYEITGDWYVLSAIGNATDTIIPRCWKIEVSEWLPKKLYGASTFFDERTNQTVLVYIQADLDSQLPEREDEFNLVVMFPGSALEKRTIQLRQMECGKFMITDKFSIVLEISRDPRSTSILIPDGELPRIIVNNTLCDIN